MATQSERLPSRFPVGTKFVIEDRRAGRRHHYTRYVVLPDGRRIDVPAANSRTAAKPARRRRSR